MAKRSVSLLGTGWLGFALGKGLVHSGYQVHASYTRLGKENELVAEGLIPHRIVIPDQPAQVLLGDSFWESETVIVTLPFRRSFVDPMVYVHQIHHVVSHLQAHQRVVFTSSTSYYPECDHEVDESLAFCPVGLRGRALAEAEACVLAHAGPHLVLRLGGLYGPGRAIGQFAARGLQRHAGASRVNLVHREDVVQIVMRALTIPDVWSGIFNVVSDGHPTRDALYVNQPTPIGCVKGKVVSNAKIKSAMGVSFLYPDPCFSR